EHARRIAFRRRWLAEREADLADRHREARERIDDEQHVLAAVAEVLGDRRGGPRTADALERRAVGGSGDDDHLRAPGRRHQLEALAAALADEPYDDDVRLGLARDLFDEHALAATGAGEDADALAAAAREQRVDHAHAGIEAMVDAAALVDRERAAVDGRD